MRVLYERSILFPGVNCELQSGSRGTLQVHPGGVQDGSDEGSRADLSREQLLQPRTSQELPQGTATLQHITELSLSEPSGFDNGGHLLIALGSDPHYLCWFLATTWRLSSSGIHFLDFCRPSKWHDCIVGHFCRSCYLLIYVLCHLRINGCIDESVFQTCGLIYFSSSFLECTTRHA